MCHYMHARFCHYHKSVHEALLLLLEKLADRPALGSMIMSHALPSCPTPGPPLLLPPASAVPVQPALPPVSCITAPMSCPSVTDPGPLEFLLLLPPPCFHAMDAAYQVLTSPSASWVATAVVQPPGRKLPKVCSGHQARQTMHAASTGLCCPSSVQSSTWQVAMSHSVPLHRNRCR